MLIRVLFFFSIVYSTSCELLNLTCDDIKKFVDGHNWRRKDIADGNLLGYPSAENMKMMVWDQELAEKSSKWASKNLYKHNPDDTVPSGRFKTGENIHWHGTTSKDDSFDLDSACRSWWSEHKQWKYKLLTSSEFTIYSPDVGHFTQMIWADSTQLGCAVSKTIDKDWTKYIVVCNYGPAGNYLNQYPFKAGPPTETLICDETDCSHLYGENCEKV